MFWSKRRHYNAGNPFKTTQRVSFKSQGTSYLQPTVVSVDLLYSVAHFADFHISKTSLLKTQTFENFTRILKTFLGILDFKIYPELCNFQQKISFFFQSSSNYYYRSLVIFIRTFNRCIMLFQPSSLDMKCPIF